MHTGNKPFACQICERKFAEKGQLVQQLTMKSNLLYDLFAQKEYFQNKIWFLRSHGVSLITEIFLQLL